MINYDSIFNLSSGVTCNWCIQLDALQSIALICQISNMTSHTSIIMLVTFQSLDFR